MSEIARDVHVKQVKDLRAERTEARPHFEKKCCQARKAECFLRYAKCQDQKTAFHIARIQPIGRLVKSRSSRCQSRALLRPFIFAKRNVGCPGHGWAGAGG